MSYLSIISSLDEEGKKRFEIHSIFGQEKICADFTYVLEVTSSTKLTLEEFESLPGNSVTISIGFKDKDNNQQYRYINGIIYSLSHIGHKTVPLGEDGWIYRIEISSWLRQLKMGKDSRIFQAADNTYFKIANDFLKELGFNTDVHFQVNCETNFPTRNYVTQYNETYYDFFTRLIAQEGLLFRFEHTQDSHLLIFEKDSTQFPEFPFSWVHGQLTEIHREGNYQPVGNINTASYDWQKPGTQKVSIPATNPENSLKTFHYPGREFQREELEKKSTRLIENLNSSKMLFKGSSSIRPLTPGFQFKLNAPELEDLHDKSYLIVGVSIDADNEAYHNTFEAIPATQEYFLNPEGMTPKPLISGSQTAIVVGAETPSNVSSEKHGRVKIRFHWDHNSPSDDTWCAGYVRVAMPGAGKDRGFVFTPQVGEEVVVTFEDGDPDKPIIIGSVYTGNMNLPSHPGEKPTKSIIKTHADKESNQVSFDDKEGKQLLYMNAKKDFEIHVLNDSKISIKNNAERKVEGEQKISIAKNETIAIKGDQKASIEENYTLNVDKDAKQTIGQNYSYDIGEVLKVNAKGDIIIKGASISFESTKGDISMKAAKNIMTDAGENIQSKSGKAVNFDAGTDLVSKAGKIAQIEGGNSIMVKSTNIDIKGSSAVTIKGGKTTVN